jgi:hypothetical protein
MNFKMRGPVLFCVGLLILLDAHRFGAQPISQTPEQAVTAVEQRWLANEGNANVVQSILADDFVHVLPSGFITKDEQMVFLRRHSNAFGGQKHFENLRVRIYGNAAIANGIVANTGDGSGIPKKTAFTDVFVLRDGKWLAVNAQELPLTKNGA